MAKTYKCPYCDKFKGDKDKLAKHIESKHPEMIPEGFTPERVAFNIVNNHPMDKGGTCIVCKNETEWNENNNKYNRLCGRKICSDKLRENYKKNMLKVYGKTTLLNDEEQQEKMLAHRSISGTYKFSDGGVHVYTGSYEQKALEFIDKVLHFKSTDILSPGPTLEYKYKGKLHKWITDIMIIPFNLIIEVKDGGDNPNNRTMTSYREKQIEKEKIITNMGTYNYLRLTNNNFEQLLEILVELKDQMIDDSDNNKKTIINIHEEVQALREMVFKNYNKK
jgi:hypothetical protein